MGDREGWGGWRDRDGKIGKVGDRECWDRKGWG